ncbi:MAG: hypothetical protein Q8M08_03390 [Bacteroidales bacterium]|nr:hypothetical protein [Bacteroidales bacterium]
MRFYRIKKGNHYASISIFERIGAIGWKINTLSLRFVFRKECWWAPPRNQDDYDLNKLAGIGFGTNHHNNSVRLAWVPDFVNEGMINLYGYTYDEKKEDPRATSVFIKSVHVQDTITGKIECKDNGYFITVNDVTVRMDNINRDPNLCFKLFPYLGGNNTAPHDMTIELEMS